jgi:hypothetical protein
MLRLAPKFGQLIPYLITLIQLACLRFALVEHPMKERFSLFGLLLFHNRAVFVGKQYSNEGKFG